MNARRAVLAGFVAAAVPLLAGFCENAETDPSKGGYLDGVCGLRTGAYQRRAAGNQQTLGNLDDIASALGAKLRNAQAESGRLERILAAQARENEALKRSMRALDAEIAVLTARRDLSQQDQLRAEASRDRLRAEVDQLFVTASSLEHNAQAIAQGVRNADVASALKKAAGENLAASKNLEQEIDKTKRDLPR